MYCFSSRSMAGRTTQSLGKPVSFGVSILPPWNALFKNMLPWTTPFVPWTPPLGGPTHKATPMPIPFALVRNLFLTTVLFAACVPARKYDEAAARNKTMQAEVDAANAKARDAQAAYDELR